MAKDDEKRPIIIIKKIKKSDAGHHGGAWKVAYADFVTAMMAFFLLLWLLNVTTDKQKELISSYFAPTDPRVSQSQSGAGGVMGGTSISEEGAMTDDRRPRAAPDQGNGNGDSKETGDGSNKQDNAEEAKLEAEFEKRDTENFKEAEQLLKQAIDSVPELKALAQNLMVDMTPEGLRVQIIDQEGKPMFETGSAKPLPAAEKLLRLITQTVHDLPNKISIRGHTDSKPYGKDAAYTNWELSADRANASRRVMLTGGLNATRIENVQGKAEREPLDAKDPTAARNRRISIILMKLALTEPKKDPNQSATPKPLTPRKAAPPPLKKQEEGVIYFP